MPLSTREINNLKKDGKTQTIEDNTSVFVRSGLNKKQRTRVFGKTRIGNGSSVYEVNLGLWGRDFKRKEEILVRWETLKQWGKSNNCKLTEYGKEPEIKSHSLVKVFQDYIQQNPENCKEESLYTSKNR